MTLHKIDGQIIDTKGSTLKSDNSRPSMEPVLEGKTMVLVDPEAPFAISVGIDPDNGDVTAVAMMVDNANEDESKVLFIAGEGLPSTDQPIEAVQLFYMNMETDGNLKYGTNHATYTVGNITDDGSAIEHALSSMKSALGDVWQLIMDRKRKIEVEGRPKYEH